MRLVVFRACLANLGRDLTASQPQSVLGKNFYQYVYFFGAHSHAMPIWRLNTSMKQSGSARWPASRSLSPLVKPIEGGAPLAYYLDMIFIETPIFTKRLRELLTDDSYAAFQRQLAERPDMGDVIEGAGGIRKVRVASSGHGKRGGSRVIYYHFTSASQIALLLIYPKNEQDDLSADERKVLKQIIERWR